MWQPARVRIIEASLADAAALQSLHITTWMATYRGLVPESFYRERSTAHRGRDWADLVRRQRAGGGGVLIARSYGGIDGLCQYGPTEDNDDDPLAVAQVHRLYVHPLRQRQGIGRALLSRATACLQGKGMVEVTLWILERDSGARAFYEHLGWQSDGSRRFDGATDVRYRRLVREGSPATDLVVRESSVELMIERSLPSSRSAHAAHGTACLDRQSWAVTDGRGAPARNRQLILAARQTPQRRTITPRGIRRQIQQQPAFGSEANTLPLASAAANPILHRRNRDAREGNAHGRSRRSDSEVLAKHVKSVSAAPCSG